MKLGRGLGFAARPGRPASSAPFCCLLLLSFRPMPPDRVISCACMLRPTHVRLHAPPSTVLLLHCLCASKLQYVLPRICSVNTDGLVKPLSRSDHYGRVWYPSQPSQASSRQPGCIYPGQMHATRVVWLHASVKLSWVETVFSCMHVFADLKSPCMDHCLVGCIQQVVVTSCM